MSQARADSWMPPKVTGLGSPAGQFVLRLIPGSPWVAALGVKGEPDERPARAMVYQLDANDQYRQLREITLRNPVAPLSALVSDRGALVTLDNRHGVGVGSEVLVVYRPDGTVLRSYGLESLCTAQEIERFRRSVSVDLATGAVTRRPSYRSAC